jgi:hypothetical protein
VDQNPITHAEPLRGDEAILDVPPDAAYLDLRYMEFVVNDLDNLSWDTEAHGMGRPSLN